MMICRKFFYAINVLNFCVSHCFRKIAIDDPTDDRFYERQLYPIDLHHLLAMTEDRDDNCTLGLMSIDYDKSAATQLHSLPLKCQQKCGVSSDLIW